MPRRPNSSPQTIAVLAALRQSGDWRHGLSISRETGLKPGTLYPLLLRLHEAGYLESQWLPAEKLGRPPRHAYRLTDAGRALAEERLAEGELSPKPA